MQATVVEVVNLGYLRPHHVEETGLAPFIEALNGPQEVVHRLEADNGIGVRDGDTRRVPAEPEALFKVVLSVLNGSPQGITLVALMSPSNPDVVFVGDVVELSVEIAEQVVIERVRLVARLGIRLAPLHLFGSDYDFVCNHGVKPEVVAEFAEEPEDLVADLRQVVVGVESVGRPASFGLEGRYTSKVGIGQEFVTELGQPVREDDGIADLQLAYDEKIRAALLANNDTAAAFAAENGRIASLVNIAVELVAHQSSASSDVTNASGQFGGLSGTQWSPGRRCLDCGTAPASPVAILSRPPNSLESSLRQR